jgi:hypothetical protein
MKPSLEPCRPHSGDCPDVGDYGPPIALASFGEIPEME